MKNKIILSIYIFSIAFLTSCMASKPSNAIEELGEQVIRKKEGIDIRLTPIDEIKEQKK